MTLYLPRKENGEQHLREFTAGVIYRDDTGGFTKARELLAYYPDDVLRFLLTCDWNAVGGDGFPIGRIGSRGDALGLRVQISKAVQHKKGSKRVNLKLKKLVAYWSRE